MPNYLLTWAATTTEGKTEEDLIAGARDFRSRAWLEEGVVGRWVQQIVSAKIFEFLLGNRTGTAGATSPSNSTYSPASTVPSMSIYRGLYPDELGNTVSLGYSGMKVDTWELTIEQGADARLEVNFAGKNATIPTKLAMISPDMSLEPFTFVHSKITYGGSTITLLGRLIISGNQNLEARYSAGAQTKYCVELREGAFEISARFTPYGKLDSFAQDVLGRKESTIVCTLAKSDSTIDITLNNIAFGELPDELTGLEPVEIELPLTARPISGYDSIRVIERSSKAYNNIPY